MFLVVPGNKLPGYDDLVPTGRGDEPPIPPSRYEVSKIREKVKNYGVSVCECEPDLRQSDRKTSYWILLRCAQHPLTSLYEKLRSKCLQSI